MPNYWQKEIMVEEFRVKYKIKNKQDDKLDKEIRSLAKKLGFKWWASGYNLEDGYRDVCFDKIGG